VHGVGTCSPTLASALLPAADEVHNLAPRPSRVCTTLPMLLLLWLSAGPHNLTITKLSEARMGAAWLESISIDPSGHFLQPPPSPGMRTGRRMLFVGDSFT